MRPDVRSRRRLRASLVAVSGVAALAACGTTVPTAASGQQAGFGAQQGGGAGASAPALTTAAGASAPAGAVAPGALTPGITSPGGAPAAGSDAAPTSVAGGPAAIQAKSEPVQIGVVYASNLGAAYAASGTNGNLPSDDQLIAAIKHQAAWINSHGGMAGHQVQLVLHGVDPSKGSFDQAAQEACTDLTQDHKVVAAVYGASIVGNYTLPTCLQHAGAPTVWQYRVPLSNPTFASFGGFVYQPAMLSADRLGAMVDVAAAHGWFTKGAKIGLLRWNDPNAQYLMDKIVKPKLAKLDVTVAAEFTTNTMTGESDAGGQTAAMGSAVLKFRNAGVTHVLFSPSSAVLPWLFSTAADGQQYHPKYLITSMDSPAFQTGNMRPAQLDNTVVLGWTPDEDLSPTATWPANPETQLCTKQLNKSDPSPTHYLGYCDGLLFLKTYYDKAGALSPAALNAAVAATSPSYRSAWTLTTSFAGGRHDGPASGYWMTYGDACNCFRYVGNPVPLP